MHDIARQAGKDPLDAMLDLALDEDLATIFTAQLLNSDEAAVARLLNHPHSLISLSDAGAHLTFFNDAGFGPHRAAFTTPALSRATRASPMTAACRTPCRSAGADTPADRSPSRAARARHRSVRTPR